MTSIQFFAFTNFKTSCITNANIIAQSLLPRVNITVILVPWTQWGRTVICPWKDVWVSQDFTLLDRSNRPPYQPAACRYSKTHVENNRYFIMLSKQGVWYCMYLFMLIYGLQFPGPNEEGLAFLRERTGRFPRAAQMWFTPLIVLVMITHPETAKLLLKTSGDKSCRNTVTVDHWIFTYWNSIKYLSIQIARWDTLHHWKFTMK